MVKFIGAQKDNRRYPSGASFLRPSIAMTEKNVAVSSYPIRLGQFLKLADMVQDGFEAKIVILEGEVEVNGVVEIRRGRQLQRDDVVTFRECQIRCG